MTRPALAAVTAATLALGAAALAGPPSLIFTGQLATDLSADGKTVLGYMFDPTPLKKEIYTYTLGVGPLRTDSTYDQDGLRFSDDGTKIAFGHYDLENLAGYGPTRVTPHFWSLGTGEINLGKPPNGANCDSFTFAVNDISGNGRYITGGGYTGGQCGPFRGMRYDTQTALWEQLPVSTSPPPLLVAASMTRGDAINADGTVIVGADENYDSTFTQKWRGAAVWVKNGATWTETVLDRYYYGIKAVSADGNTLVGFMSAQTMQATFGTSVQTPVRWTRSGSNWIPHNLGGDASMRPVAVSADGTTIVGSGGGSGGFIWRATINGGVPISLSSYVASLGGSFPGLTFGAGVGSPVYAVSADGNSVLISTSHANSCLPWFASAILALNGAPCEPASIALPPVSHYNPAGPLDEPFGMVFNCFITGSWPMTIQWQKETGTGTGVWEDLTDDNCSEYIPENYNFRGTDTMQLRLGALDDVWSGRYRCVVTNSCGSQTSPVIRVATCFADFDHNNYVNGDDFDSFAFYFFYGLDEADIDGNGFVNGDDFDSFASAFYTGC